MHRAVAERVGLVVTKRAEDDFRAIWRAVARDDIRSSLRMLVEGNYLLLYEYHRREVVVEFVAAVDGRRDLFEMF